MKLFDYMPKPILTNNKFKKLFSSKKFLNKIQDIPEPQASFNYFQEQWVQMNTGTTKKNIVDKVNGLYKSYEKIKNKEFSSELDKKLMSLIDEKVKLLLDNKFKEQSNSQNSPENKKIAKSKDQSIKQIEIEKKDSLKSIEVKDDDEINRSKLDKTNTLMLENSRLRNDGQIHDKETINCIEFPLKNETMNETNNEFMNYNEENHNSERNISKQLSKMSSQFKFLTKDMTRDINNDF